MTTARTGVIEIVWSGGRTPAARAVRRALPRGWRGRAGHGRTADWTELMEGEVLGNAEVIHRPTGGRMHAATAPLSSAVAVVFAVHERITIGAKAHLHSGPAHVLADGVHALLELDRI